MDKVWTKEEILNLIKTDNEALLIFVNALWDYQTPLEQKDKQTKETNGRGFTHADGSFLSSIKNFYDKTGFLTPKQLKKTREAMPKYATQLTKILNGKFLLQDIISEL